MFEMQYIYGNTLSTCTYMMVFDGMFNAEINLSSSIVELPCFCDKHLKVMNSRIVCLWPVAE